MQYAVGTSTGVNKVGSKYYLITVFDDITLITEMLEADALKIAEMYQLIITEDTRQFQSIQSNS